jgi:hypothetical protein
MINSRLDGYYMISNTQINCDKMEVNIMRSVIINGSETARLSNYREGRIALIVLYVIHEQFPH